MSELITATGVVTRSPGVGRAEVKPIVEATTAIKKADSCIATAEWCFLLRFQKIKLKKVLIDLSKESKVDKVNECYTNERREGIEEN